MSPRACLALVAALVLSACAAPVPTDPRFVPIRQLLAETEATPYECAEYDRVSRTCSSISRMRAEGDLLVSEGSFLLQRQPRLTADARVTFRIENGQACGNLGDMEMDFREVDDPRAEAQFTDIMKEGLRGLGEVCVAYYKLGEGRYVSQVRDLQGRELPDGQERVTFFAQPPRLRVMTP